MLGKSQYSGPAQIEISVEGKGVPENHMSSIVAGGSGNRPVSRNPVTRSVRESMDVCKAVSYAVRKCLLCDS